MGWGVAAAGPPVFHDVAEIDEAAPRRAVRMPISSGFGMRFHPIARSYRAHRGIDIPGPRGAPIRAVEDGVVTRAGWSGGYGNLVEVDHGGGVTTRYGHLDRIGAFGGERVYRGAVIGQMGTTGRSTGTHLHFEVRDRGFAIDPIAYLSTGARRAFDAPVVETETRVSRFAERRTAPAGLREAASP